MFQPPAGVGLVPARCTVRLTSGGKRYFINLALGQSSSLFVSDTSDQGSSSWGMPSLCQGEPFILLRERPALLVAHVILSLRSHVRAALMCVEYLCTQSTTQIRGGHASPIQWDGVGHNLQ